MKSLLHFAGPLAVCLGLFTVGQHALKAQTAGVGGRKTIVMLVAEPQYATVESLPAFAAKFLEPEFNIVLVTGSTAAGEMTFQNVSAIARADLLLVSVRRRTPPSAQLAVIREYVRSGKPVVGIRTASHAFKLSKGVPQPGNMEWPEWDGEVLGGNYHDHYRDHPPIVITAVRPQDPILRGVKVPFTAIDVLYKAGPLKPGAVTLLQGTIPGQEPEPVAWTFQRKDGGRSFYTSLGGPADFANPSFQQLLRNGISWALGGVER